MTAERLAVVTAAYCNSKLGFKSGGEDIGMGRGKYPNIESETTQFTPQRIGYQRDACMEHGTEGPAHRSISSVMTVPRYRVHSV